MTETFANAPALTAIPLDGYHTGRSKVPKLPIAERQVIAWDTEGMSLSGQDRPQHAVIFGSSAGEPIVGENLSTFEMLHHILRIDRQNPGALHVGFGWRYDSNMIVKGLEPSELRALHTHNRVTIYTDEWIWTLHMYPGKWFQVTRRRRQYAGKHSVYQIADNQSVKIYDYSSFFQRPFVDVASELLRKDLSVEDANVLAEGKAKRGTNEWIDLPEVLFYWSREIQLIRRTFEVFRAVMVQAGFTLKDWYGPGALANYILAKQGMHKHMVGAQVTTGLMPLPVHEASKRAFAGGRFEMFKAGRTKGPIHVYDINSAYPFALTMVPSLAANNGFWQYQDAATIAKNGVGRFGIYHIRHALSTSTVEYRPMPFFHRDHRGLISFPGTVDGWYMSPEARMAENHTGIEIIEGWVWISTLDKMGEPELPWTFLHDMYDTRMRLGKKNLLSLPFKLGPNSLYGKLAQTVGWNKKELKPPKSHALPIAAWVTSYCRAMLWGAIMRAPEKVIAVETDSVVTLAGPEEMGLKLGSALGEWGHETYDEIIYIQSGMYHARRDSNWLISKSRGLDRADVPIARVLSWLEGCAPGADWKPLRITTQPRFIGLAYSIHTATADKPLEASLGVWRPQKREIKLGETGKRRHLAKYCPACLAGTSLAVDSHPLSIGVSRQFFGTLQSSQPRRLPWEHKHTKEVQEIRANSIAEKDLVA